MFLCRICAPSFIPGTGAEDEVDLKGKRRHFSWKKQQKKVVTMKARLMTITVLDMEILYHEGEVGRATPRRMFLYIPSNGSFSDETSEAPRRPRPFS